MSLRLSSFLRMVCQYSLLVLLGGAFITAHSNADTHAVKVKEVGIADLTVKFKEIGIADETWKIKGSCSGATSYTSIKIKEVGIADITVKVKSYGLADKNVCIKNPSDIPEWLMKMLD